jgi:hypothetical protein
VAGKSIAERVQWLGSLGHEIAQHTHFYAGAKISKADKVDDLSNANINHCVHRDFEILKEFGFQPKGFTAGSWFVNDAVFDVLVELGFVYDCSAQFPGPQTSDPLPNTRWLRTPEYYSNSRGRIPCLPTTCSLGQWFKWGLKTINESDQFYQIVYLHDYDLLSLKSYILLLYFLKLTKCGTLESAASLAKRCLLSGGTPC